MSVVPTRTTQDPDAVFTRRFMPEIVARSRRHFAHLDPAGREEAVQDCVCRAWSMYRSAIARGKTGAVAARPNGTQQGSARSGFTAASLAMFSNLSFDSGVRFTGLNRTDVMAPGTRASGRVCISSLSDCEGDVFLETFRDRRAEGDPARLAGERIDWSDFKRSGLLSEKSLRTLDLLALGFRNGELSRALGVCPARVSQIVHENVANAVVDFFGPAIVPPGRRTVKHDPQRKPRKRGTAGRKRQKKSSRAKRRVRGAA